MIKYARIRSVVPSSCAAGCRAYIGWLPKPHRGDKRKPNGLKKKQGRANQKAKRRNARALC